MISSSDLRKGIVIELGGELFQVLDYHHIKVGRGSAQTRLKLRDIHAGHITERTFSSSEKFTRAHLEYRSMQYLYSDNELYYFMDIDDYEQLPLNTSQLGDALSYLKEGMSLQVSSYKGEVLDVELPTSVELEITNTDPGFKGDTATGGSKPATLETGLTVQVPLFINTGDVIKVDTRNGSYLERAS
jgi:elongation factor P